MNKHSDGIIQHLHDALENEVIVHQPLTSGIVSLKICRKRTLDVPKHRLSRYGIEALS